MAKFTKITPRENEVLNLIAKEYTTIEIASKLFLSPETVMTYRKNILSKFEVRNVAGMIRHAFDTGILTPTFISY